MNDIFQVLRSEIPSLREDNVTSSFADLSLDSFDLVALRGAIELRLGKTIDDHVWTNLRTPADIIETGRQANAPSYAPSKETSTRRNFSVGMPQMSISGLSEPWLFKEVGDLHWQLITDGLGTPSSRLMDGNGDRLYATFTRVRMEHSAPLKAVRENDPLEIAGTLSRYGGGIFISEISCAAGESMVKATVASSFAKRGAPGTNQGLMKGQPAIPEDSPIRVLSEKPQIIEQYQQQRALKFDTSFFECDYKINPYHDINGVGLLYFAAYPSIADTCELAYMAQGNSWAEKSSTVFRDVFYFANSDADETLVYSVVGRRDVRNEIEIDALISRKDGRVPIAFITTRKTINGR